MVMTREQYITQHMPVGGDPLVEYPRLYEEWRVLRIVQREETMRALRAPARLARAHATEAARQSREAANAEVRRLRARATEEARSIRAAEQQALRKADADDRELLRRTNPIAASALDHLDRMHSRGNRQRARILASQNGRCFWCEKVLGEHWHLDHHVPRSRGGTDALSNRKAVCVTCNQLKGVLLPEQFAVVMSLW